jgi:hypothetical protein
VAALGDQNMKSVMDSFDMAEERKRAEPTTDEPVVLESESPAEGKVLSSEEDLKEFWKTDKKDYEWKEQVAADLRERMLAAGITEEQLEELYAEIAKLSPDKDFQGLNINEWEGRIDAKEIGVSLDGNLLPSSLTNALFQAGLVDITKFSGNGDKTLTMDEARKLIKTINEENKDDPYFEAITLYSDDPENKPDVVSSLVRAWATTSNDDYPLSLAIQEVAKKLFEIENSAEWSKPHSKETADKTKDLVARFTPALEAFLKAQYDATQAMFKERGISEVKVYRGMYGVAGSDKPPINGGEVVLISRPLSSWSTSEDMAEEFSLGEDAVLFSATFPVEKVFATPFTGIGCLSESEFVLLAGIDFVDGKRLN